jgi:hypothetical protein
MQDVFQLAVPEAQCVRVRALWNLLGSKLCLSFHHSCYLCNFLFLIESWSEGLLPVSNLLWSFVGVVSDSSALVGLRGVLMYLSS